MIYLQLIDELEDRLEEGPPECLNKQYSAVSFEELSVEYPVEWTPSVYVRVCFGMKY